MAEQYENGEISQVKDISARDRAKRFENYEKVVGPVVLDPDHPENNRLAEVVRFTETVDEVLISNPKKSSDDSDVLNISVNHQDESTRKILAGQAIAIPARVSEILLWMDEGSSETKISVDGLIY